MRRYLLDTGIVGDFLDDRHGIPAKVKSAIIAGNSVGIGTPVLAEIVYGFENSSTRDRNMRRLVAGLRLLRVWPFEQPMAYEYGRLAAELRRRGRPMQQIDMMIAAIAFTLGNCTVVSKDSDLLAVPNLAVENWAEPAA